MTNFNFFSRLESWINGFSSRIRPVSLSYSGSSTIACSTERQPRDNREMSERQSGARVAREWLKYAAMFVMLLILGIGNAWGTVLFHETFGDNSGSARAWNDSYKVQSGVSAVYSGASYTISNFKQSKNTVGSTASGLILTTIGTDAVFEVGPLNVSSYESLAVSFQYKAGSVKGTYDRKLYYKTSSGGSWTSVSVTGTKATSFNSQTASLPAAAAGISTLYLKVICQNSKGQDVFDEFELTGTAAASGYSITYHCNDATSGCPSNASGQSALPNPLPSAPTKTGFTFGGWYTNSTLTTAAVAGATLAANADLYAKWTCNVTLNRNGATETINNVVEGTELDDIDGTGVQGGCSAWTFIGWSKTQRAAQNNTSAMTLVTTVDGAGPYYAVYRHTESGGVNTASSDNISSESTSAQTLETGKPITYTCSSSNTYSDPARIYKNSTLTIAGGTITEISLTGVEDYAVSNMTVNTGTLTPSGDDGTWEGSATSVVFTASSAQTRISAISVTYTGGDTYYYSTTATCCTALGSINGSVSWTNAATAVVSWDNIDNVSSWTVKYKTHAPGDYSTWAGDQSTAAGRRSVTITGLTPCTNYDFQIIANPASSYCDKDETIEDSQTHNWTVTTSGVTNATPNTAWPSTTCSGGFNRTITAAAGYDLPSTISVSGASHTWNSSTGALTISSVTGNVSITITPTVQTYSITYKDKDDSDFSGTMEDEPRTHTYGTPTTLKIPTKENFSFGGWFTASDCESGAVGDAESATLGATDFTADIILYAKWVENTHTVTYDKGDADTGTAPVDATEYTHGAEVTVLGNSGELEKEYFSFKGWTDRENEYEEGETFNIYDDVTLTPTWDCAAYVTISKGNSANGTFELDKTGSQYTCDAAQVITVAPTPITGYEFYAITQTGLNSGVSIDDEAKTVTYARWANGNSTINVTFSAKDITITWNANGGTVTPASSSYTYNGSTVELPTPTRVGYDFDGWYTAADGGTEITEIGTTNKPSANITYYAHWTIKHYTVTWLVAGVESTDASRTTDVTHGTLWSALTKPSDPADNVLDCADTFMGWSNTMATEWYENDNHTAPATLITDFTGNKTEITGDITFRAVFATRVDGYANTTIIEDFEKQTASTTYNTTKTYNTDDSNVGIAWSVYYGTVSTNNAIVGSQSTQMRWYATSTSNKGYIKSTIPLRSLNSIKFKAKVSNINVKMDVAYSTNGKNWTNVATSAAVATTKSEFSYAIPGADATDYYIKIGLTGTAPSSGTYNFFVDSIALTYKAPSVTYQNYSTKCAENINDLNEELTWPTPGTAVLTWDKKTTEVTSWAVACRQNGVSKGNTPVIDESGSNIVCTITGLTCGEEYDFTITGTHKVGYKDKVVELNSQRAEGYAISIYDTNGEVYDAEELLGTYTVDVSDACASATVTVTVAAEAGYVLDHLDVYETADASNKLDPEDFVIVGNEIAFEMPEHPVTVRAYFEEDPSPAISLSQTETYAFSSANQGSSPSGLTFRVNARHLNNNLTIMLSGEGAAAFCLNKTSINKDGSGSVSNEEVTITPVTTNAGTFNATVTVDDGVGDATARTFNVSITIIPVWSVTWKVNGIALTGDALTGVTTSVIDDNKVTVIPSNPANNTLNSCANKFMGWTDATDGDYTHGTSNLYSELDEFPAINNTIVYYAVFAEHTPATNYTWTLDYSKETALSSNTTDWGSYGTAFEYTTSDGGEWVVKAYKSSGMQINIKKDASIKIPDCDEDIKSIAITCSATKAVGFSTSDYDGASDITYILEGTDATSQVLDFTGISKHSGYIVPKNGSTSITKIVVTYGTPETITNYVTQCDGTTARVTYDINGGSGRICEDGVHEKTGFKTCDKEPTKNGYTFAGWNDGSKTTASNTTYELTSDINFTASWTPIEYNITYHSNGGSGAIDGTYTIETATFSLATPTRNDGHDRFNGWYNNSGLTGDPVATTISVGSTGDIEVWAKWSERYTVQFYKEDALLAEIYRAADEQLNASVAGQGSAPADPSAPALCSSKTFVGWSESAITLETDVAPGDLRTTDSNVSADKTFYAVWATDNGNETYSAYSTYCYNAFVPDGGTGKGNWSEAGNWSSGSAPDENTRVVIDNKEMTVDVTDAKAKEIVVKNAGKLIVAPGKAIIVAGKITKDNGAPTTAADLKVESSAAGNGTLIFENDDNAATVEMYSIGSTDGWKWQYIGVPFEGANAQATYYGAYLYKWNNGWTAVQKSDELEMFAGYCISYPAANYKYVMDGTLAPTTGKDIAVSEGKSMVVGNSWTAPIQITQFEDEDFDGLLKNVYLYNTGNDESHSASTTSSPTGDAIYAAGTYISVPIHSAKYTDVKVISSLQGFFVKDDHEVAGGGTLSLSYSKHVRPSVGNSVVNGAMHAPKRVADETDRPAVLKMKVSGSQYDDRLILLEREDFTIGYDAGWDGDKMGDVATSPRITTTREDGTADAVAALPDLEGTLINFRAASTDDQYTLYFDYETEDAEPLYLLDLTNNAYTRVETGSSYTFVTTDKADHKRFALTRYRAPQITTDVEEAQGDNGQGKAVKFIENDKLYILRNGVLYDGTGKKVIEN